MSHIGIFMIIMNWSEIIPYVQIVLSVILIGSILMQQSEASLGSAFGVDGFSQNKNIRRGVEKIVFIFTIIVSLLFIASSIFVLLIK